MLSACSTGPDPEVPKQIRLPGPGGLPPKVKVDEGPPGPLGLGLAPRERDLWRKLTTQLYSPCPDQAVSIQQCIDESRPCGACKAAAALLALKVKEGADEEQARAAYGVRFGPNLKQVDVADSPVRGPANAPVTLIVWTDFECPH